MSEKFSFTAYGKNGKEQMNWNAEETAAIVIDMWDKHWCQGASKRVEELAPAMNEFLEFLRSKGIKKIIHCPTNVSQYYKASYARLQTKKYSNEPIVIPKLKIPDIRNYIDPYTVQCDCETKCDRSQKPWTRENRAITILGEGTKAVDDYDLICDESLDGDKTKGKEWFLFHALEELGIKNIFIMGVHTNMCMIYRNFAIKNLVALGKYNLVMLKDMTDGMLPREEKPYKNHFDALEDVFDFIRTNFCPTARSADISGKRRVLPYFSSDQRYKVLLGTQGDGTWFDQESTQKASRHKLPIGMKYEFSDDGYLKNLQFIYDYTEQNAAKVLEEAPEGTEERTKTLSVIAEPENTAVPLQQSAFARSFKGSGSTFFTLGTRIFSGEFYIQDHKIIGVLLHPYSDIGRVESDYCIGDFHDCDETITMSAPKGMTLAGFYGEKNGNGEITCLGCNFTNLTYFWQQKLGQKAGVVKTGFFCKNWENKLCAVECIEGNFWIYPDNDTTNAQPMDKLIYKTVNHTCWRTSIDGISFKHYYSTNEVPNHKSCIIAFLGDYDEELMVTFSDADGHMYIPENEQQTNYENVDEKIPYYQRTSL